MIAREVWTVKVTDYPAGSHSEDGTPYADWEPEGWQEVLANVDEYSPAALRDAAETGTFFWPREGKVYLSRSTARKRAQVLRAYGATAVVLRGRIEWEETTS